jgi:hypothetical protein
MRCNIAGISFDASMQHNLFTSVLLSCVTSVACDTITLLLLQKIIQYDVVFSAHYVTKYYC